MLIDQMEMHPEDFRGYGAKFRDLLEAAQRTTHQPATASAAYQMSSRDSAAIMAAAETHLFEVWLAQDVLTKIMAPNPEPVTLTTNQRVYGKSALQGQFALQGTTNTSQHTEQVYQMEQARSKMEIEEQQKRDLYHAQRNTKPLFGF